MFTHSILSDAIAFGDTIDILNPLLVARIRRAADTLNAYEISAQLHDAIAEAAHARDVAHWEEYQLGQASADAIVECEYHDELAAAWSLVASEHRLITHDGSVH